MKFDDYVFTVEGPAEMADERGTDYTMDQVEMVFENLREALEQKLQEIDIRLEVKGPT